VISDPENEDQTAHNVKLMHTDDGAAHRQEEAHRKFERRLIEVLETEDEALRNMQRLGGLLREWIDDESWPSNARSLLITVHDTLRALRQVHKHVRGLVAAALGREPHHARKVAEIFSSKMGARLVEWHSKYEEGATQLSKILHARQDASVSNGRDDERKALDLLLRPTQRMMKYSLFLDALLEHAPLMRCGEQDDTLVHVLREANAAVRNLVHQVNQGKLHRDQLQRVHELASRVRDVPEGVVISKLRRRVIFEAGNIMQRGREGYRKVFVFNDAVLVCKQGMHKVDSNIGALEEMRFKDLISLRGISLQQCPNVIVPSALLSSVGGGDAGNLDPKTPSVSEAAISENYPQSSKERAFSLELRGRLFLAPKLLITQLVDAIREVSICKVE
jgi:hypothetical protein